MGRRNRRRVVASPIPLKIDFTGGRKIPETRSPNESAESHRSYSRTIWVHASTRETPDTAGGKTHDSAGVRTSQAGNAREPGDGGDRRRAHRESGGGVRRWSEDDAQRAPHRDGARRGTGPPRRWRC